MKYLKSILEHFEDINFHGRMSEDIKQDLKDICLELEDEGFSVKQWGMDHGFGTCGLSIYLPPSKEGHYYQSQYIQYPYSKIEETVERVKEYMKINGYSTKVSIVEHSASYRKPPIKGCYVTECEVTFQKNNPDKIRKFERMEDDEDIPLAEIHRLGSGSHIPITKDNLPKEGDKVRCVPGFMGGSGSSSDSKYGGAGYESGRIFTVKRVEAGGGRPVIWGYDSVRGNGVYYEALEYV